MSTKYVYTYKYICLYIKYINILVAHALLEKKVCDHAEPRNQS